jgi:hypothetical protein
MDFFGGMVRSPILPGMPKSSGLTGSALWRIDYQLKD